MPRRAICKAALILRPSRTVISSASRVSIASMALTWPRSSWPTTPSNASKARGMRKATRFWRMRSTGLSGKVEAVMPQLRPAARRLPTAS